MTDAVLVLVQKAIRLIDSVEFDVNGSAGKGGNGGLTSNETMQAAGELRVAVHRVKRKELERPGDYEIT